MRHPRADRCTGHAGAGPPAADGPARGAGAHRHADRHPGQRAARRAPANCAFHLRTLAKYGYVEEAGAARAGSGRGAGTAPRWSITSRAGRTRRRRRGRGGAARSGWTGAWTGRKVRLSAGRSWPAEWQHSGLPIESEYILLPDRRPRRVELGAEVGRLYRRTEDRLRSTRSAAPAGAMPDRDAGCSATRLTAAWLGWRLTCPVLQHRDARVYWPARSCPYRGQRAVAGHGHLGETAPAATARPAAFFASICGSLPEPC